MEELELLTRYEKVKAPPDFEQKVMAQLSLRKRGLGRKRSVLRLSLAGAFASFVAVFILLNVFVLRKETQPGVTTARTSVSPYLDIGASSRESQVIPVIETVDYGLELRNKSTEVETIYLLEQVMDTTPQGIKY